MNGYFRPLRRKLGVITLMMTSLFSGAWLRSLTTFDKAKINGPFHKTLEIFSRAGHLEVDFSFNRTEGANFLKFESGVVAPFDWTYFSVVSMTVINNPASDISPLGDCFITSDILYILIVLPMTLLSAWLLLSQPRPATDHPACRWGFPVNGYFRPLRRKLGVITLVMTSLFSGAWLRSLTTFDGVTINGPFQKTLEIASRAGHLEVDFFFNRTEGANFLEFETNVGDPFNWTYFSVVSMTVSNSNGRINAEPPDCFITSDILYGLIVIPLTMLSAWLLLSKPHKSNQKKITESNSEKLV